MTSQQINRVLKKELAPSPAVTEADLREFVIGEFSLSASDGLERIGEMRSLQKTMRFVLKTLPPSLEESLRLVFFEEMTAKEIGSRLGVSSAKANQLYARALRMLRHPERVKQIAAFDR